LSHPVLERRRAEQRERIERAALWACALARRVALRAAVVFGSSARGDFNKWSDIDVLVISDDVPEDARERLALIAADAPPGLQPVAWSSRELLERRRRGDPIARECDSIGVLLLGSLPR
jgi:hypothetical protein